jgi:TorA maturation chaperone TorD
MTAGADALSADALSAEERGVLATLARAGVYRLLGAAFAYPAPERLPALLAMARDLGGAADPELRAWLARFAEAVETSDALALTQEHVFLFDRGARCPPYEGAWGEAPQLAGKPALLADVAGFYAAWGMTPAVGEPDMEDHVAAECEFMSALCLKEARAEAHGEAERRTITRDAGSAFVADHLGRWTEPFAAALREATPLPYYGALADLLAAWMRLEARRLGVTPTPVADRAARAPLEGDDEFTCPMAPGPAPEPDA